MEQSKIRETAHKLTTETISRYVSGILATGTIGVCVILYQRKLETVAYILMGIGAVSLLLFARLLVRHWIYKMIEKRATEIAEKKVKEVDELVRYYQQEQYKINCSDSDRITKLGFLNAQNNEELRKGVQIAVDEQLLPMNVAIAVLVRSLSNIVYNSQGVTGMHSRSKLEDFNDGFKEIIMKMNMPGKDNQHKEQVINGYLAVLNKCSAN